MKKLPAGLHLYHWMYERGFQEVFWTLEQLLAWIISRDPITVGSLSIESMEEVVYRCDWKNLDEIYFFTAGSLRHIASLSEDEIRHELFDAHRDAIQALRSGRLVATWKLGEKMRVEVPRFHWADHDITCNKRGLLDVEGGCLDDGSGILVEKDHVLNIWPEASPDQTSIRDKTQATRLLARRMKESPNEPTMTKVEATDWLKSQGLSLGPRARDDAWEHASALANAPAWRKGGRRRRVNRNTTQS